MLQLSSGNSSFEMKFARNEGCYIICGCGDLDKKKQ